MVKGEDVIHGRYTIFPLRTVHQVARNIYSVRTFQTLLVRVVHAVDAEAAYLQYSVCT